MEYRYILQRRIRRLEEANAALLDILSAENLRDGSDQRVALSVALRALAVEVVIVKRPEEGAAVAVCLDVVGLNVTL